MHIDEHDYWDMHVVDGCEWCNGGVDSCSGVEIDTSNPECVQGNELLSLLDQSYNSACSNGLTLDNIGYTGVDNGLITYRKDRITDGQFYKLYTGSKYEILSGDTRLHLHAVSGNTQNYAYPMSMNDDGSIALKGGFYQGFFRSGDTYSILPSELGSESVWKLDFKIRRKDYKKDGTTLNDRHPDNEGIFFYIGTRAENKWVYLYKNIPLSSSTEHDCATEDIFDLVNFEELTEDDKYDTTDGFNIDSPNDAYIESNNKFLMFDWTPNGVTIPTYSSGDKVILAYKTRRFDGNLFLYMNWTCSGYTVNNIETLEDSGSTESYSMDTFYNDIKGNALAFMVNEDGSVGYRYLVSDCDSENGYKVLSGSSYGGLVQENEWVDITAKLLGFGDSMKIKFYVNGKLKYITARLPILSLKKLDELDSKQDGVAYNISLGGGTQGLCETIMPDYMKSPTVVFPLEEHFAGTFIGDIKQFSFNVCQ